MNAQLRPRMFLTTAAKAIVIQAIRQGRDSTGRDSIGPARPARAKRPMYPIETAITLDHAPQGVRLYRPFSQMQVGQSYFEPGEGDQARERIRTAASKHLPARFLIERVVVDEQPGFRVWRVK